MDLKARLERLTQWGEETNGEPRPAAGEPPLDALVPGRWVVHGGLRCYVVERRYPLAHQHGALALGEALSLSAKVQALLGRAGRCEGLNLRGALFIDTETTGLAQSAGTYVFMVGLARYEDGVLRLQQLFMPDFGEEPALLALLADELTAADGLISFNGRCFDWPLLETRYLLAQQPLPEAGPHLDLLPLARRLWRRTLPSCALSSLEGAVLGLEREAADVPGYLIPALYHDYVRLGRTRAMAGVFYHNAMDLLSMATLLARAGQVLAASLDGRPPAEATPGYHPLSAAVLHEALGDVAAAENAYRQALLGHDAPEAARRLAALLKRDGRADEAAAVWRSRLGGSEIHPYIELAKRCEHHLHDYPQARRLVREALEKAQGEDIALDAPRRRRLLRELIHRLERVERRARAAGSAADAQGEC